MYASKPSVVLCLVVLCLVVLLCAVSAFPQAEVASLDHANLPGEPTLRPLPENQIFTGPAFPVFAYLGDHAANPPAEPLPDFPPESPATPADKPAVDSKHQPAVEILPGSAPPDFNRDIYYKNKLEFSLEGGWLPFNIPFPFDFMEGDPYTVTGLNYTLVPIIASLRWQMDDIEGPRMLRGNWDLTFSGSVTAIPRGPESRYFSYIMGIRRNFVPRNRKTAPYFDIRLGLGNIDAKGPKGVSFAQGQDFTFTLNMGSGVRYNFNSRYAISAGLNYMHLSNMDLSEHKYQPVFPNYGFRNYGINVYGLMFGIDIQLRRHQPRSVH